VSAVPQSPIRGILFDKDGTLLDFNRTWLPPYQAAANYIQELSGGRVSAATLLEAGGYVAESATWQPDSLLAAGSNRQILDAWELQAGAPFTAEQLAALGVFFRREAGDYVATVVNLPACLGALKDRGYQLGLATMDDQRHAEKMIRSMSIDGMFDFVCGADSGFGVKPEPGMVMAFCRRTGLEPDQVAMVGDSPRDILMGLNAGAGLSIGVTSGAHSADHLREHTPHVLPDISALGHYLECPG